MVSDIQLNRSHVFRPSIGVIGVGGAGGNAVNDMIEMQVEGVHFITANTDAQDLGLSQAETTIRLGEELTKGLGAGSQPEIGKAAAEESLDDIKNKLQGLDMLFVVAGMGGGTGTGASPVISRVAKELEILIVSVVTKPFEYEGRSRMALAEEGITELEKHVDTMIVIPNQNLFQTVGETTTLAEAFSQVNKVLYNAVRSVTDLIVNPGIINLDFADVRTTMQNMGKAMIGTGEAEGEDRAQKAAEQAIHNPLLEGSSLKGAKKVLVSICADENLKLSEIEIIMNRINEITDRNAICCKGTTYDDQLSDVVRVSVIATGMGEQENQENNAQNNETHNPIVSTIATSWDINEFSEEKSKKNNSNNNVVYEQNERNSTNYTEISDRTKHVNTIETKINTDDLHTEKKESLKQNNKANIITPSGINKIQNVKDEQGRIQQIKQKQEDNIISIVDEITASKSQAEQQWYETQITGTHGRQNSTVQQINNNQNSFSQAEQNITQILNNATPSRTGSLKDKFQSQKKEEIQDKKDTGKLFGLFHIMGGKQNTQNDNQQNKNKSLIYNSDIEPENSDR